MSSSDILLRLHAHQARIVDQIETAAALIALEPGEAQVPLARARWIMIRLLREYQLFKHSNIFDPIVRHGDPRQVAQARRMRADCIAAGDGFAAYVAHWSKQDLVAAWSDYRRAMRAVSAQLRDHIARERRGIEALLAGSGPVRRTTPVDRPSDDAIVSPSRSPPAARADNRAP